MPYRDLGKVRKLQASDIKDESQTRYIQEQTDIQAIKNSIRNILTVKRGSLPGDPEFGSRLFDVIFDPLDGLTNKLQDTFIRESLQKYEPRVRAKNIKLESIPEYNRVNVRISFDYINSQTGEVLGADTSIPFDVN